MSAPGADTGVPRAAPGDDAAEASETGTEPAHCIGDVCITCSDVAVPVRIMSLHGYELATVRTEAGTDEEISVALVDAVVGDIVLVHAKEAIARVEAPPGGPGMEHPLGVWPTDEP